MKLHFIWQIEVYSHMVLVNTILLYNIDYTVCLVLSTLGTTSISKAT